MLSISPSITLPESELVERFLRADGPGGQHVNRTESAVELRFDVINSPSLPEEIRVRLLARRDRRHHAMRFRLLEVPPDPGAGPVESVSQGLVIHTDGVLAHQTEKALA